MRFSVGLIAIITSFTLAGCATPKEREVAALEKELGLDSAPYFPKCLSKEVAPKAGWWQVSTVWATPSTIRRAMWPSIDAFDGTRTSR